MVLELRYATCYSLYSDLCLLCLCVAAADIAGRCALNRNVNKTAVIYALLGWTSEIPVEVKIPLLDHSKLGKLLDSMAESREPDAERTVSLAL